MDCFAASGTVGERGLQRKSNQPSRLSSLLPSIRNLSDHPPLALTKDWTSEEGGSSTDSRGDQGRVSWRGGCMRQALCCEGCWGSGRGFGLTSWAVHGVCCPFSGSSRPESIFPSRSRSVQSARIILCAPRWPMAVVRIVAQAVPIRYVTFGHLSSGKVLSNSCDIKPFTADF